MDLRIVHSANENDKYNYISAFFQLCGFMVYDHTVDNDTGKGLIHREIIPSIYEIPFCIALLGNDDDCNSVIMKECTSRTIVINCSGKEIPDSNIDFDGYDDLLMSLIIRLSDSINELDELMEIRRVFNETYFYQAFYCDNYSYCEEKQLEDSLWQYLDFHRKLESYIDNQNDSITFNYRALFAKAYVQYLICSLCDRTHYLRPFETDNIIKNFRILSKNTIVEESSNFLCAKLCELDKSKYIYAYEYYLKSLVSSTDSRQRLFWSDFQLTSDGKLANSRVEFLDDNLWENEEMVKIVPNNYLAAYGLGNSCLKYNNSERAALFCFRVSIKGNNSYYPSIYKKAICKYNIKGEIGSLDCFEQIYDVTRRRAELGIWQPRDLAYFLKSAKNIDRLRTSSINDETTFYQDALQQCRRSFQNATLLNRIIESFNLHDAALSIKNLVAKLYDTVDKIS